MAPDHVTKELTHIPIKAFLNYLNDPALLVCNAHLPDEIEPPPAEPDVVLHPVQPLLDVVAHPILGVIDVGRRAVVLAGAAVALTAVLGIIRGDRPLVPGHAPGEDVPPPVRALRLGAPEIGRAHV